MIHLVKLCVGVESLDELAAWQDAHLSDLRRRGRKAELMHVTLRMPKRAEDLTAGGSLYWVIKGRIACRQPILELRTVVRDGVPHCGIVYGEALIPTIPRAMRPFQGWRYLAPEDAPQDAIGLDDLPDALRRELASLGLL